MPKNIAFDKEAISAAAQRMSDCFVEVAEKEGLGIRTMARAMDLYETRTGSRVEEVFPLTDKADEMRLMQGIFNAVAKAKGAEGARAVGAEMRRQIATAQHMELIL